MIFPISPFYDNISPNLAISDEPSLFDLIFARVYSIFSSVISLNSKIFSAKTFISNKISAFSSNF
jgi:hypothetical protein